MLMVFQSLNIRSRWLLFVLILVCGGEEHFYMGTTPQKASNLGSKLCLNVSP